MYENQHNSLRGGVNIYVPQPLQAPLFLHPLYALPPVFISLLKHESSLTNPGFIMQVALSGIKINGPDLVLFLLSHVLIGSVVFFHISNSQ